MPEKAPALGRGFFIDKIFSKYLDFDRKGIVS
jgi:hypothetical protein